MSTHTTTTPLIGLDIGKNVHVFGTYRVEDLEPLGQPVKIHNNRAGFMRLTEHIAGLLTHYPLVKVANEPTGIYYEAFGRQLLTHFADPLATGHLAYHLVNPHLVKEARTALRRGRIRKTDAIDTQAIACCLQQGQVLPARFPDQRTLAYQQWAQRFRRNQAEMRRLRNQIILQMDHLWLGAFVNVQRFKYFHPDLEPPAMLGTIAGCDARFARPAQSDGRGSGVFCRVCPGGYAAPNPGHGGRKALDNRGMF